MLPLQKEIAIFKVFGGFSVTSQRKCTFIYALVCFLWNKEKIEKKILCTKKKNHLIYVGRIYIFFIWG